MSLKISINKVRAFISQNWKTIIELATLVTVIFAVLQYRLEVVKNQEEKENKPLISFSGNLYFAPINNEELVEIQKDFIESYLDKAYQIKKLEPETKYIDILKRLTPDKVNIPSQKVLGSIVIRNSGKATASDVRVTIILDRPINDLKVNTTEIYSIIKGDLGQKEITIDIDRVIKGSEIEIQIVSNPREVQENGNQFVITIKASDEEGYNTSYLPQISFVPGATPLMDVIVSSDDGILRSRFLAVTLSSNICDAFLPSHIRKGDKAIVALKTANLIVRSSPDRTAKQVGRIAPGTYIDVLEGPVCANNRYHWLVEAQSIKGWVIEGGDTEDPYYIIPLSSGDVLNPR